MTNPWIAVTDKQIEENLIVDIADQIFEDNFEPNTTNYTSLPDSKEYLETLERRLQRIKIDSNVLQQLATRREHCLENLLNNQITIHSDQDLELDATVKSDFSERTNEIIRHIRPEQPLTFGEIVHIIEYDHLDKEEKENESDSGSGASR